MILNDLPIGTLVKDPNTRFLGSPIIWRIADKNHAGYPTGSITLIAEKIIAFRCFDAKEPNNSSATGIQGYGNNRYSVSNIRQWLNSDAKAGQWYSPQHELDQAPDSSNVYQYQGTAINPYDVDAGFLKGFSYELKEALLDTTLTVELNASIDGGGSETVTDKIFLASNTEVGIEDQFGITEGTLFPIFSDDASRIAYSTAQAIEDSNYSLAPKGEEDATRWWVRTLYNNNSSTLCNACMVDTKGGYNFRSVYNGSTGIRPLCNLPSDILISDRTDVDGIYTLTFNTKTYVSVDNKARKVSKMYVGEDNIARKIKYAYIGVDNIARKIFNG